jgi:hypothetical protein
MKTLFRLATNFAAHLKEKNPLYTNTPRKNTLWLAAHELFLGCYFMQMVMVLLFFLVKICLSVNVNLYKYVANL